MLSAAPASAFLDTVVTKSNLIFTFFLQKWLSTCLKPFRIRLTLIFRMIILLFNVDCAESQMKDSYPDIKDALINVDNKGSSHIIDNGGREKRSRSECIKADCDKSCLHFSQTCSYTIHRTVMNMQWVKSCCCLLKSHMQLNIKDTWLGLDMGFLTNIA